MRRNKTNGGGVGIKDGPCNWLERSNYSLRNTYIYNEENLVGAGRN